MIPLLADALAFMGRFRPPDPGLRPTALRLHASDYARLVADPELIGYTWADIRPGRERLLGLNLRIDDQIVPGQWRLCADDGTLIRDSRSTNEV